jgi:DNA repair protein RecN (Recombination protein N)
MLRRLHIENLVLIRRADLALGPGLNAVTGETGAGKTILAQAIGLLLGARGDTSFLGPAGAETYVEAELDLTEGILDEEGFEAIAELRPDEEPGLVAARRVFADGRSRAYAWGRAVPREDLAALVERLIAMSGQFEQRRLARSGHQLELLDAFAGEEQLRRRADLAGAWRLLREARRRREELAREAGDRDARIAELRALTAAVEGLSPGTEQELRAERERLRNAAGLAEAAVVASQALAPDDGEGAADIAARAELALRPVAGLAPELEAAAADVLDAAERLRGSASALRSFLASLDAEPGRLDEVEEQLARIGEAKRRFGAGTLSELLDRAAAASGELQALEEGADPLARANAGVEEAALRYETFARAAREVRTEAAGLFAAAVRQELRSLGLGDGDLAVQLAERDEGPTGADEAVFLIRANAGLPFAPAATTASGGELSRIALALRAVAHAQAGEPTIVFDEIDAGIGGQTAHAVADSLRRLAALCQVVTITHLPQIASVADRHFRVEKVPGDPTHTRIELLGEDERRQEIERMLGGAEFLRLLPVGQAPEG